MIPTIQNSNTIQYYGALLAYCGFKPQGYEVLETCSTRYLKWCYCSGLPHLSSWTGRKIELKHQWRFHVWKPPLARYIQADLRKKCTTTTKFHQFNVNLKILLNVRKQSCKWIKQHPNVPNKKEAQRLWWLQILVFLQTNRWWWCNWSCSLRARCNFSRNGLFATSSLCAIPLIM